MFDPSNNDGEKRDLRAIGVGVSQPPGGSWLIELARYVFETRREDGEFAFCRAGGMTAIAWPGLNNKGTNWSDRSSGRGKLGPNASINLKSAASMSEQPKETLKEHQWPFPNHRNQFFP